ncbi:hypothetical protein ACTHOQ_00740 [Solibacillus silvestris]|uniref:hypothetical protein n=1 Tax=Solibacillus silvestris TaxID=76853 RepID=UPI003F81076F
MNYLTIGQVTIPITWLAFTIAILYSGLRMKQTDRFTNKTIEQLLLVYIIIWKLSYVFFSTAAFLQEPLSFLYFDGGMKGHVSALTGIMIILYKKRELLDWETLWLYWARFAAVYFVLYYAFSGHWLIAIIWLGVWLLAERNIGCIILIIQWPLLVWLGWWDDGFLHMHGMVLLTLLWKTQQIQQIAAISIFSLVALMPADIQSMENKRGIAPIDLPTTAGGHYALSEQNQKLTVVNFFAT